MYVLWSQPGTLGEENVSIFSTCLGLKAGDGVLNSIKQNPFEINNIENELSIDPTEVIDKFLSSENTPPIDTTEIEELAWSLNIQIQNDDNDSIMIVHSQKNSHEQVFLVTEKDKCINVEKK